MPSSSRVWVVGFALVACTGGPSTESNDGPRHQAQETVQNAAPAAPQARPELEPSERPDTDPEAPPAVEPKFSRAIPGTAWDDQIPLSGRVKRLTETETRDIGGEEVSTTTVLEFNRFGHQTLEKKRRREVRAEVDELGRVVKWLDGGTMTENLAFDDAGRVLKRRVSLLSSDDQPPIVGVTAYKYDADGRVVEERSWNGGDEARATTKTFRHDEDGDLVEEAGNEYGDRKRTATTSVEGHRKTIVWTKSRGETETEVIDRRTGMVLSLVFTNSRGKVVSELKWEVSEYDAHGNWQKGSIRGRAGEHESSSTWTRKIEYFEE